MEGGNFAITMVPAQIPRGVSYAPATKVGPVLSARLISQNVLLVPVFITAHASTPLAVSLATVQMVGMVTRAKLTIMNVQF